MSKKKKNTSTLIETCVNLFVLQRLYMSVKVCVIGQPVGGICVNSISDPMFVYTHSPHVYMYK